MPVRRLLALSGLLCASACQAVPAVPPPDAASAPLPFTALVVLGDSVASGLGTPPESRFDQLLVHNDDARYPDYRGRDLSSRHAVELVNLANPGADSADTVIQALTVQPNPSGRTLVIISLGPTEFRDNVFGALDGATVAKVSARVEANLEPIRERFADPAYFPGGAVLALFSVLDPTDAMGSLPIPVDDLFCNLVAGFSKTGNLPLYNGLRQNFAAAHDLRFVDLYQRFLGHGYFFALPSAPHYDAADSSLWFLLDCLHPNARGHHEIRRLIWDQLLEGTP